METTEVPEPNGIRTWVVGRLRDGVDGRFSMKGEALKAALFIDQDKLKEEVKCCCIALFW